MNQVDVESLEQRMELNQYFAFPIFHSLEAIDRC